jgi:hypothetical protein
MLDRVLGTVEQAARGLVYLCIVAIGAAVAVLAAAIIGVGCYRIWQYTWTHFLSHPW